MEKNRDILKACPAPGYPLLMILLLPAGPQLAGQQISNRIRKLPHLLDPDKTASVNLPGAFQVAVQAVEYSHDPDSLLFKLPHLHGRVLNACIPRILLPPHSSRNRSHPLFVIGAGICQHNEQAFLAGGLSRQMP